MTEKLELLSVDKNKRDLSVLILKLCEESGEVAKESRGQRGRTFDEWLDATALELGDVLSALLKIGAKIGYTPEQIVDAALEKRELHPEWTDA